MFSFITNFSIKFRILFGFTAVLIISLSSSLFGLSSITKIGEELKSIAQDDIPMSTMLTEITVKQLEQAILLERVLRLAEVTSDVSDKRGALKSSEDAFIKLGREVDEEIKKFEGMTDEALKHSKNANAQRKFNEIKQATLSIERQHKNYETHAEELFNYINQGQTDRVNDAVSGLLKEEKELDKNLEELLFGLAVFTEKSAIEAESHEKEALATMTTLTIIAFAIGISLGLFISMSITKPVKYLLSAMNDIAEGEGDLTKKITIQGKDECAQLGKAFNNFSEKLRQTLIEVVRNANNVATGTSQISVGNLNLSQRTEEQASSLEETASSMEEMTSTVKQNADNANQASQLAQTARDKADSGGKIVTQAVDAMKAINDSSGKISDIITVVEEIAFQTNLLALNAAVEAARAGEQGRGFAVVASEVRVLAGRSSDAAKEIKSLIEDSVDKVKIGSELVDKSGETLQEIVSGIKKVTDIVFEIAAASNEQSSGIDQVNKAVSQMDEMTQQNASLVEEAASASKSLEDQADALIILMSAFKLDENNTTFTGNSMRGQTVNAMPKPEITLIHNKESSQMPVKRVANAGASNWEDF